MDPRIREHAEIIVEHSLHIEAGDDVVVAAPSVAEDLEVAVYELLADLGANPVSATSPLEGRTNPRAGRAYLKNRDTFETPAHHQALFEAADAFLIVRAFENVAETADVDPQVLAAASKANRPVQEERLSKRWCLTQFPAVGNAQLAEMSTEAYENFVWDAVIRDWDEQREHQEGMVEILDAADEVRIVSGENTDLTMSLAGNRTLNDYGEKNLPGGEVFTAPVRDSVEDVRTGYDAWRASGHEQRAHVRRAHHLRGLHDRRSLFDHLQRRRHHVSDGNRGRGVHTYANAPGCLGCLPGIASGVVLGSIVRYRFDADLDGLSEDFLTGHVVLAGEHVDPFE